MTPEPIVIDIRKPEQIPEAREQAAEALGRGIAVNVFTVVRGIRALGFRARRVPNGVALTSSASEGLGNRPNVDTALNVGFHQVERSLNSLWTQEIRSA